MCRDAVSKCVNVCGVCVCGGGGRDAVSKFVCVRVFMAGEVVLRSVHVCVHVCVGGRDAVRKSVCVKRGGGGGS